MWELKIEKVNNGFVCSYKEEQEDVLTTQKDVIAEKEDEKEAMSELLYYVAKHFGFVNDKYEKDNLNITWDKKGRKVE